MDDTVSSTSSSSVVEKYAAKVFSKNLIGLLSVLLVTTAFFYSTPAKIDDSDCFSQFSHGQWVGQRWYPYQCLINRYPTKRSLLSCVKSPKARQHLHFVGDADLSKYFRALVSQFRPPDDYSLPEDLQQSSPIEFSNGDFSLGYFYSPVLNIDFIDQYKTYDKERLPQLVVNFFSGYDYTSLPGSCQKLAQRLLKYQMTYMEKLQEEEQTTPIIIMMLPDLSKPEDDACQKTLEHAYETASKTTPLIRNSVVIMKMNKSHNMLQGLEVIVHFTCNSRSDSTCCLPSDKSFYSSTTIPFLLLLVALYLGLLLLRATGTLLPLEPYLQAAQVDLKKSYFMINLCGAIIVSLLYICAAERLEVFFKASPWRSPLLMFLLFIAVICLGFLKTIKLNQSNGVLFKEQLLEWRGWTTLLIVGLEYSDMTESSLGFWLWQFLVCCYCFTCSYSHFVWFWTTGNFTPTRIARVLLRQNYLVLIIILTIFSPSSIYTIPIVNTIVFVIVYLVMSLPPRTSLESVKSLKNPGRAVILKLFIAGLIIAIATGIELYVLTPSSYILNWSNPKAYFTIIYSTRVVAILGMAVGYYSVSVSNSCNQSMRPNNRLCGVVVLAGFGIYILFLLLASRTDFFMILHVVLVNLPIISYTILRNWNEVLKSTFSVIFKCFGAMSLEFYILSRHILMSHDGRGLLYLFPSYYAINMLSVLVITLFLSYTISHYSRLVKDSFFSSTTSTGNSLSYGEQQHSDL